MRGGWLLVFAALLGCVDASPEPCTTTTEEWSVVNSTVDELDLLFVVDNSNSMAEEQATLALELPRFVSVLATGDFDQDGDGAGDLEIDDEDFYPLRSLHVGVVTSDMGAGGFAAPTCAERAFGDDGVLRVEGNPSVTGCQAAYPRFLDFQPGGGIEPEVFAGYVACVARVGTGGCGIEQPLDAALKALSPTVATFWTAPTYEAPRFFQRSEGNADVENNGFVRGDSLLAVVMVTDENDCSIADASLFDPNGPYAETELNLRCFEHGRALHAVERYVDGLLQLRARPAQLFFAPIVGIPADLESGPRERPDWDSFEADERLRERVDPDNPDRLAPSCEEPATGVAFPPTRILAVAEELEARGAGVAVGSICRDDYRGPLDAIVRHVRGLDRSACLPRLLPHRADGSLDCELDVLLTLPDAPGCDELPGSTAQPPEGEWAVCRLTQRVPVDRSPGAAPPEGPGWFFDTFTDEAVRGGCATPGGEVARLGLLQPIPLGATQRLRCTYDLAGGDTTPGLGTPCEPDEEEDRCAEGSSVYGVPYTCDSSTDRCGMACSEDWDCVDAGLAAFVCDLERGFCVNPMCGS